LGPPKSHEVEISRPQNRIGDGLFRAGFPSAPARGKKGAV